MSAKPSAFFFSVEEELPDEPPEEPPDDPPEEQLCVSSGFKVIEPQALLSVQVLLCVPEEQADQPPQTQDSSQTQDLVSFLSGKQSVESVHVLN